MKMDTATIEVAGLPDAIVKALDERANEVGTTPMEYVRFLLVEDLSRPPSLRSLYAPVREQIKASGTSDDELDALLKEAREEAFQERQRKKAE